MDQQTKLKTKKQEIELFDILETPWLWHHLPQSWVRVFVFIHKKRVTLFLSHKHNNDHDIALVFVPYSCCSNQQCNNGHCIVCVHVFFSKSNFFNTHYLIDSALFLCVCLQCDDKHHIVFFEKIKIVVCVQSFLKITIWCKVGWGVPIATKDRDSTFQK